MSACILTSLCLQPDNPLGGWLTEGSGVTSSWDRWPDGSLPGVLYVEPKDVQVRAALAASTFLSARGCHGRTGSEPERRRGWWPCRPAPGVVGGGCRVRRRPDGTYPARPAR